MASSLEAGKLFSVDGLVAVVTGGGSGIGLMIAQALAVNGASKIYIVGRRKETLEKAIKTIGTDNVSPLVGDVTSKDFLQNATSQIEKEVGYINVLVANAGVSGPQSKLPRDKKPSLEEFTNEFWNHDANETLNVFNVNCNALWYSSLAFLDLLDKGNKKGNVEQKSQIIATSSIAGFNRVALAGSIYGASKAAATHMMKQLSTTLAPFDIRTNIICPGLFPSEMTTHMAMETLPKSFCPLGRPGSPEDMAGTILFLTSRAGAYFNGMEVVVDGGRLAVVPSSY